MKISTFTLAAGAVALSSSALGVPFLSKRVADQAAGVSCLIQLFISKALPAGCSETLANDIGLVKGVTIDGLVLSFGADQSFSLSARSLEVELLGFPGYTVPITQAAEHITIVDSGVDTMHFDSAEVATTLKGTTLETSLSPSSATILNKTQFMALAISLLTQPTHTSVLKGTIDATVSLPSVPVPNAFSADLPSSSGTVLVPGVGFSSSITFTGMNSFSGAVQFVNQISLVRDATTGGFTLQATLDFVNPSTTSWDSGVNANFRVLDATSNTDVGVAVTTFKIVPGSNKLVVEITSSSSDLFTTLTTSAAGVSLILQGVAAATGNADVTLSAAIIAALKVTVKIPMLNASA